MTAISKSWVSIADTQVDADSPIDAALMTGLRDDLVHLREWIGASYTAGAVQDHNHDGVNSAAIEIGPNFLRNGNFENGTSGWTATQYTGGTIATNTSNETEGTTALSITSTVAANGGGNVLSNEFIKVVSGQTRQFMMTIKASGATVPVKSEVIWYDDAQSQISASTIISTTTASPTSDRLVVRRIAAPATAKFCKVKLELPAAGSAAGTVYFDAVSVTYPAMMGGEQLFTASGTFSAVYGDVYVEVQGCGGGGGGGGSSGTSDPGGTGGQGGRGGFAYGWFNVQGDVTVTTSATGGSGGAGGSSGGNGTAGSTGTTSSFGSFCTGPGGGGGGAGQSNGSGATNGTDQTGTGGSLNVKGNYSTFTATNKGDPGVGGGGNILGLTATSGTAGAGGFVLVRW